MSTVSVYLSIFVAACTWHCIGKGFGSDSHACAGVHPDGRGRFRGTTMASCVHAPAYCRPRCAGTTHTQKKTHTHTHLHMHRVRESARASEGEAIH